MSGFIFFFDDRIGCVHPSAAATALHFAFRTHSESDLILFILAVILVALLVLLQLASLGLVKKYGKREKE